LPVELVEMGRTKSFRFDLEEEVRGAIRAARLKAPPTKYFAYLLAQELGWTSLSRQTIYGWESGNRIPAVVLVAAARVTGFTVDQLMEAGKKLSTDRRL
jgi:hypothetical protein